MRIAKRSPAGFLVLLAWMLLPAGLLAKTEGLFYYVPGEDGWRALLANARKISILAPQVFTVDLAGAVRGTVEKRTRSLAAQYGIRIMPLLVNENFSSEVAHSILSEEHLRQRVISDSVRLCQETGCWGLQLDFEGVLLEDGKHYTQFVREAAQALHARGLQLSVAVPSPLFVGSWPPETYELGFGGFPVASQPYDLREIARHVDFLSLMSYDHHGKGTSPGPIAGYPWVEQSIRYVLRFVPRQKVSLGLGFYARQWCDQQVSESSYLETTRLANGAGAALRWHALHRSPWFELEDTDCRKVVWFENRQSLREKLKLVRKYGLQGFSAWRLGQEDPNFWKELPERRMGGPKSAGTS